MSVATDTLGVTDGALTAQHLAIEESGWGEPYRFFQPRNLAFWVFCWLVAIGTVSLAGQITDIFGAYQSAITSAYIAFAVYTIPFWLVINYLDRFHAVPGKVRIMAFVWGGLVATWVLAINANLAVLSLYGKIFGQAWVKDWGPGLTAPFTEEISKGLGVALIIVLAPKVVRSAFDGFIIGAFVGLGFQVFENVSYVVTGVQNGFGAAQGDLAANVIITRASVGLTSHTVYSAIFGMGLVWFIGRPTEPHRRILGLTFMATSMLIHGVWDSIAALSGNNPALTVLFMLGLPVFAIAVFFLALKYSSKRTRHWMHDLMEPEVLRGTITEDELDALAGTHHQRKQFIKSGKGHKSHVHAKHVVAAATDLGRHVAESGGADTADVQFARTEVARVRG